MSRPSREGQADAYADETRAAYRSCLWTSGYLSVAGVAASLPAGLYYKRYWPLVVGGLAGSYADYAVQYGKCAPYREELEAFEAYAAAWEKRRKRGEI